MIVWQRDNVHRLRIQVVQACDLLFSVVPLLMLSVLRPGWEEDQVLSVLGRWNRRGACFVHVYIGIRMMIVWSAYGPTVEPNHRLTSYSNHWSRDLWALITGVSLSRDFITDPDVVGVSTLQRFHTIAIPGWISVATWCSTWVRMVNIKFQIIRWI